MKTALSSPPASSPKEELADWLELRALCDGDLSSSLQDLMREIRRNGSVDAFDSRDWGSSDSERIAEGAFAELEGRLAACGPRSYPFRIDRHSIALKRGYEKSPYIFQLLLTRFGLVSSKGVPNAEKTFEEISALAARRYLGPTDNLTKGFAFGFPRRHRAKNFSDALDDLCVRLGEGEGCKIPTKDPAGVAVAKKLAQQKDGKLDVVAWRSFPDGRAGKLIGFGQCATGSSGWRGKLSDLRPEEFGKLWLRGAFSVDPVRMFFVPHRVEEEDWASIAIQAGILFDRCRIAHHCAKIPDRLARECALWTKLVISSHLKRARRRPGAMAKKAGK